MEVIKKGSVESLLVVLRDRLANVNDLADVTNLRFDTVKKSDGSSAQTNVAVVLDVDHPMTAICQIDTTLPAYVAGSAYKLYIKYAAGTEFPILGPLEFRVEDD